MVDHLLVLQTADRDMRVQRLWLANGEMLRLVQTDESGTQRPGPWAGAREGAEVVIGSAGDDTDDARVLLIEGADRPIGMTFNALAGTE